MPSMPVKNSEKLAFRPGAFALLLWRLLNVKHDGDPILIVISYDSLVCVRCIWLDHSVFFDWAFGRFEVRQLDVRHLQRQFKLGRALLGLVKLVLVRDRLQRLGLQFVLSRASHNVSLLVGILLPALHCKWTPCTLFLLLAALLLQICVYSWCDDLI